MTNFDWRTDEEQGWERPQAEPPVQAVDDSFWRAAGRRARNGWRALLATVFVLAAVTTLGARTVTLRVQAAEEAVGGEVRAAHGLVFDAARNGDEELFMTMLGGDRSWRQAQESAFEHGAVFGRSVMGLEWQPEDEPLTEIQLSPDLQWALVTSTVRYEGYAGDDGLQPIALQHVWRYENDGTQWRLAPHEEGFWQGWATHHTENLQTVMPRRDEALAEQLNEDIGARLDAICEALGGCPRPFSLHLRFEQSLETLHMPSMWITGPRDRMTIALPAPSLLGTPADEAAYRAVLNGYLRIVVDEFLNTFARSDRADSNIFRAALQRQVTVELDLVTWPGEVEQENIVDANTDILALCADGFDRDTSLLRYDASTATWQRAFEGRNVTRMLALDGVPGVLLQERRPQGLEPHPRIVWWRDGQDAATFEELYLGDVIPGSATFLADADGGQTFWIWLGQAYQCDGGHCPGAVVRDEPTSWSPDGAHTLFRRELEGSRSPPAGDHVLWLGDRNGVALKRLEEGIYPFWIDDSRFGYLTVPPGRDQSLPSEYDLVIRGLDGDPASEPLTRTLPIAETLQQLAPTGEDVQEIGVAISHTFVSPDRPQTIYIIAVHLATLSTTVMASPYTILLLAVDATSGEASIRIASQNTQWMSLPQVSPDGRWLAYATFDPYSGEGAVAVHELTQDPPTGNAWERPFRSSEVAGFRMPYEASPVYDWSQRDGRLLTLDGGVLTIVDPQTWREQHLVPPTAGCAYAAWAD